LRRAAPQRAEFEAFRRGLRELGYIEGQNVIIEQRYASGDYNRLPGLASEFVRLKVDVLVVDGVATAKAIKSATGGIPIIFTVGDPVAIGLVASLARPGGTITGVTTMSTELTGKRLQLLTEALPGISRVALLWNPASSTIPLAVGKAQTVAKSLGLKPRIFEARKSSDFASALAAMTQQRAEALLTLPDAMLFSERSQLVDLTIKHRLSAMFPERDFVDAGGLMAYGPNIADNFRRAAAYVDKILKGAKPADLPVEQPTKFELIINLKTAKALGLTIPQSLLLRADQVIE
jgi:ABC-type uncharacterized transport system substrate-binding protein